MAGSSVRLRTAGRGAPLLVLHHDIGTPEQLPFYEALAQRFTVLLPSHPGYDGSERPDWMRSVRDVAVTYQRPARRARARPTSRWSGLGFGGWIAAEMATMAPRGFRRLVLVGAMGIKPAAGRHPRPGASSSYIDYARAGFDDQAAFDRLSTATTRPTDQLEQWDICREMTFRIAWKPYMYSQTLPHLLGGVRDAGARGVGATTTGSCRSRARTSYARALPNAGSRCVEHAGHFRRHGAAGRARQADRAVRRRGLIGGPACT